MNSAYQTNSIPPLNLALICYEVGTFLNNDMSPYQNLQLEIRADFLEITSSRNEFEAFG
jgi:hypothetical protein